MVLELQNNLANDYLKSQTDTFNSYYGFPTNLFTNDDGLSTVLFQSLSSRYYYGDYFGNIEITQFGDNGDEIWGTVLPLYQYHKSQKHNYYYNQMNKRFNQLTIFGENASAVYTRQFVSYNSYCFNKSIYVVFNDYDNNFNKN